MLSRQTKEAVLARDGYRCVRCGWHKNLTVDHIVPRSRGGSDGMPNLQTFCYRCNQQKADSLPQQGEGQTRDERRVEMKERGRTRVAASDLNPALLTVLGLRQAPP